MYRYDKIKEIDYGTNHVSINANIIETKENKKVGVFLYDLFPKQKKATIFYIEVGREQRKKGISKNVINKFIYDMKCEGIETIDIRYVDKTAEKIWNRLGFKKDKGIIMKRDISSEKCKCIKK